MNMSPKMRAEVSHYYRKFRQHQAKGFADDNVTLTVYPSGRTELTSGGPYGEHALSAYLGAKQHVAFLKRLRAEVSQ